jgi:hypothetical protein
MSWENENYAPDIDPLVELPPGRPNWRSLSALQQTAKNPFNQGVLNTLPENVTNKIQGFLAPHSLRFAGPRNILKAEKNRRNAEQAVRNAEQAVRNAEIRQIQEGVRAQLNAEQAVRNRNRLFREKTTMPTANELRAQNLMEQGYARGKSRNRRGKGPGGKYVERGNRHKKTRKTRR